MGTIGERWGAALIGKDWPVQHNNMRTWRTRSSNASNGNDLHLQGFFLSAVPLSEECLSFIYKLPSQKP